MTKRIEIIELRKRKPNITVIEIAKEIGCHKCTVTRALSKSTHEYQKLYRNTIRKDKRNKIKRILVDYKGGCCNKCGYNKSLVALEFHHIDPNTKLFGIGDHKISRTIEELKKESDKCILVCANCHREIHAK